MTDIELILLQLCVAVRIASTLGKAPGAPMETIKTLPALGWLKLSGSGVLRTMYARQCSACRASRRVQGSQAGHGGTVNGHTVLDSTFAAISLVRLRARGRCDNFLRVCLMRPASGNVSRFVTVLKRSTEDLDLPILQLQDARLDDAMNVAVRRAYPTVSRSIRRRRNRDCLESIPIRR